MISQNLGGHMPPTSGVSEQYLLKLSNDWFYIYKGPKILKCRIISLLEEYFLLLNTFYTLFVTCTNFKVYKCHHRAPGLLSSRVMSTYTMTLYTPGHLQISWDVFAKKSADILSFCILFITVSREIVFF